jgi:multiple sugar transport system substrate-binding protein
MNNSRFIFYVTAVLFTGILTITGCGDKSGSGKDTVVFWHSFVSATQPALNELVREFEQEHPEIRIRAQYVPSGDALIQRLITAIQSRTAPDISWIHSDFLQNLVEADAIYRMDYFIDGENGLTEEDLSDIYPALLQAASWKDTLYSMPMEATNLGLIYNRELFRQAGLDPDSPPRTWDELRNTARRLTIDKTGNGTFDQVGFFVPVYPASGPLSSWMVWQWMPYLWQAGGYEINLEQTEVLYNREQGVKALSLWKQMYDEMNLRAFSIDYEVTFASQQLAMVMDGPWSLPRYRQLRHLDWGVAPLPAGPEKSATVVGGEYLTIFKQSKNPDAAWTFVKWILRPDVQARWSMKSGYLPVRRSVTRIPEYVEYLDQYPEVRVFVEQMESGQSPRPIDYHGLQITRHVAEAIERACLGRMDPAQVLNESAGRSNDLLRSVGR